MSKIEKIMGANWEFTVYKIDDLYIIQVAFCQGPVDYTICYRLLADEIKEVNSVDIIPDE